MAFFLLLHFAKMVFWRTLREMFTQKMSKTPKTNKYKHGISRAKVMKKIKNFARNECFKNKQTGCVGNSLNFLF